MSDGNKFDLTAYAQQRQQNKLPFEEMGNVLLDAMQGTLICLDSHHTIVDVSKTIKRYFGFEQGELIGLSILLLIEDSERDSFAKFLNSPPQPFDVFCVRMMMGNTNEYRQVRVHRKKKVNQDNVDVDSTTSRHSGSIDTILVLTLNDSSYIDITLFDINKQEFYTKMNLLGEITFEDHRGALITGYLPHEIISQSIFNFVYHEDRLVKLHALWKCATTGSSKLQWRLKARDGSLVFLQTEYKLVSEHQDEDAIVARNEMLTPVQKSQFDELRSAWRHQCAADIKGNSSSFKRLTTADVDLSSSSLSSGECRIAVPSLNMCFSTNKLQPLSVTGNIFDASKPARALSIQDYISVLIDQDKCLDNEMTNIISNIQSLTARYRRLSNNPPMTSNDVDKSQLSSDNNDAKPLSKASAATSLSPTIPLSSSSNSTSTESTMRRKPDCDSIVRGILSNSIKYTHDKQPADSQPVAAASSSPTLARLLNGNNGTPVQNGTKTSTSSKSNITPPSIEVIRQQHLDFIKKYNSAKAKLESQLEVARAQETANGGQAGDVMRRANISGKLSQLEAIKSKHLARTYELQRQAQHHASVVAVNPIEQQDLTNSFIASSSPNPMGSSMDNSGSMIPSPLSSLFVSPTDGSPSPFYPSTYHPLQQQQQQQQQQRNSSPSYRSSQQFDGGSLPPPPFHEQQQQQHPHTRGKTPTFDEFLTPPLLSPFASSVNNPSLSVHSYMNVSFQESPNDPTTGMTSSPFSHHHHHHHHHHHQSTTYPY